MSDVDRHNANIQPILKLLVIDERGDLVGESDPMVLLESVITGLLRLYRPDPQASVEFLDVMTMKIAERLRNEGQPL